MSRKFEIFLAVLYVINVGMSIVSGNYVAAMGWGCALLSQLRILSLIDND